MEDITVVDSEEEKVFPIRFDENNDVTLELICNNGLFLLMSTEGYITFTNKGQIVSVSENEYYIKQEDDIITLNKEEHEMICAAIDMCEVI